VTTTRPPQPLDSYSLEQIAYLMPVEADIAACAASKAVKHGADNPIAYFTMLLPGGTGREEFGEVIADC
jgi:hypothetical protein